MTATIVKRKAHQARLYLTDAEWEELQHEALRQNKTRNQFLTEIIRIQMTPVTVVSGVAPKGIKVFGGLA